MVGSGAGYSEPLDCISSCELAKEFHFLKVLKVREVESGADDIIK